MSVIQASVQTTRNWRIAQKLLNGLKYSHSTEVVKKYSLDVELANIVTLSQGAYTAESVIDVIGLDTFKKMIENLWNPTLYNWNIGEARYGISNLPNAFDWGGSPEGYDFWYAVRKQLSRAFREDEFRGRT